MNSKQARARRRFDPDHLTTRDVLVLAPAILAFLGLQVVFAVVFGEQLLRWFGLLVDSAILFGYFIHDSHEQRGELAFWVLVSILLIIHFVGFTVALSRAHEWKPVWFGVMILELPIFFALRNRFA